MAVCLASLMVACKKSKGLTDDPYAGGKQVLGITFISKTTDPDIVTAGTTLNLQVNGLMKYKDNFKLYVNEIEAEVLNYTDSTIQFKVPLVASTGSVWITSQGQSFFGPIVKIGGKVSVDAAFKIVNGASAVGGSGGTTVYDAEKLPTGLFWLGGSFSSFEQKGTTALPNGGIVQVDADGAYSTSGINFGKGAVGGSRTIYSINRISTGSQNGKFIVAGSFTAYNSTRSNRQTLNNITRLNANGSLDTIKTADKDALGNSLVPIVNPKPEQTWKNGDTVAAFNAGVDGAVRKTFVFGEQIYIVGNFQNFKRIYYPNSTYDEKVYDITRMRQMVRVNADGSMDSTFHYNKTTRQSAIGGNGAIIDATMQSDGKLILVGSFSTFNGVAANRIVRLNLDGSVDPTFSAGSGADGDIYSIRYNATTDKIVISGNFSTYNGKASSGVALLNANGSVVTTFNGSLITGGIATFAGQLNNGKIIVAGSFNRYGDYLRQGFMILDTNGQLAVGYNNTGGFQGRVYDMIETGVSNGSQVVLVGDIYRFNSILPHNVLRLIIAN
ncbi:delta-60 repeat domain-containing protein [Pedobacter soli]|nr:delta-60 repeat domain-containing protein [Pedobacter soli]